MRMLCDKYFPARNMMSEWGVFAKVAYKFIRGVSTSRETSFREVNRFYWYSGSLGVALLLRGWYSRWPWIDHRRSTLNKVAFCRSSKVMAPSWARRCWSIDQRGCFWWPRRHNEHPRWPGTFYSFSLLLLSHLLLLENLFCYGGCIFF